MRTVSGLCLLALLGLAVSGWSMADEPDWSGAPIQAEGRSNPYGLSGAQWDAAIRRGRMHALSYPVEVSGLLVPYRALQGLYQDADKPFRQFLGTLFGGFARMRSLDELFAWVGLLEYPESEGSGPYFVPFPDGRKPGYRMGFGLISRYGEQGVTLSCASCHASDLFGRKVLGMTNRFARANETFIQSQKALDQISAPIFQWFTHASEGETRIYEESRQDMGRVGLRAPRALGLDTSLAQVALSLARRGTDEWAEPSEKFELHPRAEVLRQRTADSKPAVWWNVKYKNRWLSDGSVVSGNPIYTNFLWNEIGRGTDLHALDAWLSASGDVVRDLTAAVFASEAPRIVDFFPASSISLESAKHGQSVFERRCERCHGSYEKNWEDLTDPLKTTRVIYHASTPVVDVGTDAHRAQGMKSLERGLNPLAISKREGIVIQTQAGYVPPPLVGIWARWPYFHNNSVPSLCGVLTRHEKRPQTYYSGEARDRERDFDLRCNGYPIGAAVPAEWKKDTEHLYDTREEGMSNAGHDEGVFLDQGRELLTDTEKMDLIAFLQTL